MEWVPTARLLRERVATPLLFNAPVPRVVGPTLKVTVPVGEPTEAGRAVAVRVIMLP